jgi:signal peptidase II
MVFTIICFVIAALVVVIDQITKIIAVDKLLGNGSFEFIPGVLHFTYVENDGMALGLLDNARWVFMVVSTVAILGLIAYMIFKRPENKFASVAMALIIGGGIGNMIDRFFYNGVLPGTVGEKVVRDFIDVRMFGDLWPWVFNFADSCVCVGGAILFVWALASIIKESADEKKNKAPVSGEQKTSEEQGESGEN